MSVILADTLYTLLCAGKVLENRSWLSVDSIVDLFWAVINFFVLL